MRLIVAICVSLFSATVCDKFLSDCFTQDISEIWLSKLIRLNLKPKNITVSLCHGKFGQTFWKLLRLSLPTRARTRWNRSIHRRGINNQIKYPVFFIVCSLRNSVLFPLPSTYTCLSVSLVMLKYFYFCNRWKENERKIILFFSWGMLEY